MNPTKTGGELMWAEMVSSYWSTCDTACATVKRHHMIGKLSQTLVYANKQKYLT